MYSTNCRYLVHSSRTRYSVPVCEPGTGGTRYQVEYVLPGTLSTGVLGVVLGEQYQVEYSSEYLEYSRAPIREVRKPGTGGTRTS